MREQNEQKAYIGSMAQEAGIGLVGGLDAAVAKSIRIPTVGERLDDLISSCRRQRDQLTQTIEAAQLMKSRLGDLSPEMDQAIGRLVGRY